MSPFRRPDRSPSLTPTPELGGQNFLIRTKEAQPSERASGILSAFSEQSSKWVVTIDHPAVGGGRGVVQGQLLNEGYEPKSIISNGDASQELHYGGPANSFANMAKRCLRNDHAHCGAVIFLSSSHQAAAETDV
ncbi:insecticidal toxin complex protein [Anopheles sinensis]|uniref:Insecticidal toxin complex protein n=1 Tax=Anopheles sinensis TaxID=74873 RepID=A0A084WAG0_ANOSI|nr:insecticidal toxin complex protein [Anopheles sinensis]